MGSECSRDVNPAQLDDLKNLTAFSGKEIRDWYRKFHADCPSGCMSRQEFVIMYQKLFPQGDASQFAESVFRSFDLDGNGEINFREFLVTLNVTSRGSIDDKLRWVFSMYDADNSGYVTKDEVLDILRSIFKMKGSLNPAARNLTPEQACEELFEHLDRNGDEKLSSMEFVVGAKSSGHVLGILQSSN